MAHALEYHPSADSVNAFAFPGAASIQDEAHFGIVWVPPYVARSSAPLSSSRGIGDCPYGRLGG
jgi:hypothetical protein